MPTDYEYVLLKGKYNHNLDGPLIFVGHKRGSRWDCAWGDGWTPFEGDDITHWMPLPTSPEEFEEEMLKFTQGFAYKPKHEKE